jgi:hypothetical protein
VEPLPRAVEDEVLGDAESRIAGDVGREVLLAVAVVQDLQDQVEAAALLEDDSGQARVVGGLRDPEDGQHVRREDSSRG